MLSLSRALVREIDRPQSRESPSTPPSGDAPVSPVRPPPASAHKPARLEGTNFTLDPVRGTRSAQLAAGERVAAGVDVVESMRVLIDLPARSEAETVARHTDRLARATSVVITQDEQAHELGDSALHLGDRATPASLERDALASGASDAVESYLSSVLSLLAGGDMAPSAARLDSGATTETGARDDPSPPLAEAGAPEPRDQSCEVAIAAPARAHGAPQEASESGAAAACVAASAASPQEGIDVNEGIIVASSSPTAAGLPTGVVASVASPSQELVASRGDRARQPPCERAEGGGDERVEEDAPAAGSIAGSVAGSVARSVAMNPGQPASEGVYAEPEAFLSSGLASGPPGSSRLARPIPATPRASSCFGYEPLTAARLEAQVTGRASGCTSARAPNPRAHAAGSLPPIPARAHPAGPSRRPTLAPPRPSRSHPSRSPAVHRLRSICKRRPRSVPSSRDLPGCARIQGRDPAEGGIQGRIQWRQGFRGVIQWRAG